MDRILVINAVFAIGTLVSGLYSRSLLTALAAGFWIALVHGGLILLSMGQAGMSTVTELPLATQALDLVMQSGYANFAQARLVAYFAGTSLGLMLISVAAFIVSWAVTSLRLRLLHQRASA